jgi:SnoaL-like domain
MIRSSNRWAMPVVVAASFILALGCTLAQAGEETQVELNKKSVVEFYDKAFNQKDFEAAKVYFGPQFVEHNPAASGDGTKDIEGIKRFLSFLRSKFPQAHFEIQRVIAGGGGLCRGPLTWRERTGNARASGRRYLSARTGQDCRTLGRGPGHPRKFAQSACLFLKAA